MTNSSKIEGFYCDFLAYLTLQEALMNLKKYGETLQAKVSEMQKKNSDNNKDVAEQMGVQMRRLSRKLSQLRY